MRSIKKDNCAQPFGERRRPIVSLATWITDSSDACHVDLTREVRNLHTGGHKI